MPLFRPSELLQFLESHGLRPKKRLSQNFLIDGNILKKIGELAELQKDDVVVEIGPGPGVLTEHLVQKGCRVIAIEKDSVFAKALSRFPVEVYDADFLKFPLQDVLQKKLKKGEKAKVVSNIPYHLTSPIMEKIIEAKEFISSAILMVQEEVAKRCVAKAGSKDFSSFSVFLQFYSEVHYGFFVKRGCFFPPPRVDSAVIRLDLKKRYIVSSEKDFFQMVHAAFQKRRKQLTSSLRDFNTQES